MLDNLSQYVPSEVCLSCDGCCRFKEAESHWRPKVTEEEAGLAGEIFAREHLDDESRIKTKGCAGGLFQCRFFAPEGNLCTVYAYRPFECRLYPYILRQRDGALRLSVHLNCPHIEQTRRSDGFERYVSYLRDFFKSEEGAAFVKRNGSSIDSYASYEDELEDLFTIDV